MINSNIKRVFRKRHPFSFVCRAWQLSWWWKSTMGVCNRQPLAEDMDVHCEVESGGVVSPDNLDSKVISFELL